MGQAHRMGSLLLQDGFFLRGPLKTQANRLLLGLAHRGLDAYVQTRDLAPLPAVLCWGGVRLDAQLWGLVVQGFAESAGRGPVILSTPEITTVGLSAP